MSILCSMLGHKRSARKAKLNPDTLQWESLCKRCDEPLVRFEHDDWRPAVPKV